MIVIVANFVSAWLLLMFGGLCFRAAFEEAQSCGLRLMLAGVGAACCLVAMAMVTFAIMYSGGDLSG